MVCELMRILPPDPESPDPPELSDLLSLHDARARTPTSASDSTRAPRRRRVGGLVVMWGVLPLRWVVDIMRGGPDVCSGSGWPGQKPRPSGHAGARPLTASLDALGHHEPAGEGEGEIGTHGGAGHEEGAALDLVDVVVGEAEADVDAQAATAEQRAERLCRDHLGDGHTDAGHDQRHRERELDRAHDLAL